MAKPETKPQYHFVFLGFHAGWYSLRADMSKGPTWPDALTFENNVVEWLIEQRITPGTLSHIGNGNTSGTGPWLPAVHDGSHICLLLKRPADVLRFEMRFPCRGITPQTMLAALRDEATVVRIGPVEIARVAYAANCTLNHMTGEDYPAWEDAQEVVRQFSIAAVKLQMLHPDWTPEHLHDHWMQDRLNNGWTYGPKRNFKLKTHPSLVPFNRLTPVEQAKDAMFSSIVQSLLPLMEGNP